MGAGATVAATAEDVAMSPPLLLTGVVMTAVVTLCGRPPVMGMAMGAVATALAPAVAMGGDGI